MTPKRLEEIRNIIPPKPNPASLGGRISRELLAEVDRLRAELALTRLEVEAAWDAYDEKDKA